MVFDNEIESASNSRFVLTKRAKNSDGLCAEKAGCFDRKFVHAE